MDIMAVAMVSIAFILIAGFFWLAAQ